MTEIQEVEGGVGGEHLSIAGSRRVTILHAKKARSVRQSHAGKFSPFPDHVIEGVGHEGSSKKAIE